MKKCVIFCAGEFSGLLCPMQAQDLVIAADGGLVHTQALGLTPGLILGDFDSLGRIPAGAEVFPVEKDDTDSMLAIKKGLAAGCDRFLLYGALDGPRVDHTMANFQALQYLADRDARGWLIGKQQIVTVLKNGSIDFPAHCRGTFSVFCLGADAEGVTIRGSKYEMDGGVLTAGFPLGVSNHFIGSAVHVEVTSGSLLLIWDRECGIW